MSKKQEPVELVKVLHFFRDGSGFGFVEVEIPKSTLTQGKTTYNTEPDVFAICINQLTKRVRDLFEI